MSALAGAEGWAPSFNLFGDPAMPGHGALGKNEITISGSLSATGRIYFHVPSGIQYGFHNLDVDFGDSRIEAPFDIFTKEREKEFEKKLKELKKKKDWPGVFARLRRETRERSERARRRRAIARRSRRPGE